MDLTPFPLDYLHKQSVRFFHGYLNKTTEINSQLITNKTIDNDVDCFLIEFSFILASQPKQSVLNVNQNQLNIIPNKNNNNDNNSNNQSSSPSIQALISPDPTVIELIEKGYP